MGQIIYNGVDLCETFHMNIVGRGTYGAPARDIEQVHVPGRNGDLLFDNGGYKNIDITFPECLIEDDFPTYGRELAHFLLTDPGYHKLMDSYDPGFYRMAEYRGPFEPAAHTARKNRSAVFDLVFNCKPLRYLEGADTAAGTLAGAGEAKIIIPAKDQITLQFVNDFTGTRTFYVRDINNALLLTQSVPAGETVSADIDITTGAAITVSTGAGTAFKVLDGSGRVLYSTDGGAAITVYNPYKVPAYPLIEWKGFSGEISVNGGDSIALEYTTVNKQRDCEHWGDPILQPGENNITITQTRVYDPWYVRMYPRWATI